MNLPRKIRQISEREIAMALVLEYVKANRDDFSLSLIADDDLEFIASLAKRLQVEGDLPFKNKLTRVVRRLVNYSVLDTHTFAGQKFYLGIPNRETRYALRPGKADLLRSEFVPGVTLGGEGEAEFLLRRAYPRPDDREDDLSTEMR